MNQDKRAVEIDWHGMALFTIVLCFGIMMICAMLTTSR